MGHQKLIGVTPESEENLEGIAKRLILARRVGLELPDGYQERGEVFSNWALRLERHGPLVVPLETEQGYDNRAILKLAKKILEGSYPIKQFMNTLRAYREKNSDSSPMTPEIVEPFQRKLALYEKTHQFLSDRDHRSLTGVLPIFERAEVLFERTALRRIRKNQVDSVVVSYDRAVRMHPQLPQYKLERL